MYKAVFIDMFNLAYRENTQLLTYVDNANAVINFINNEVIPRLESDGTIYLLFDSLPKSDLGISKNFKYSPDRTQILASYKRNRSQNPVVYKALLLLRKYYIYRGDKIKICISNSFEADDYVEDLLRVESKGNIALVTNDSDWSRYIDDRVSMINTNFSNPYTKEEYFAKYGMAPTVASITLRKAIFGDGTDGVPCIFPKKSKINKDIIMSYIGQIAKSGESFEDVEKEISTATYRDYIGKTTPVYEILAILNTDDTILEALINNLRVVKCRCKDALKYTYSKPVNEGYNKLMETTLGRIMSTSGPFYFGAKISKHKKS